MSEPKQTATDNSDSVVLYRVDVIDRRTMTSRGVSIFARNDLEAFEAIRDEYPQRHFDVIDRATGKLVELDDRERGCADV